MLSELLFALIDNIHKVFFHVNYISLRLLFDLLGQGLGLFHLGNYFILVLLYFVLLLEVEQPVAKKDLLHVGERLLSL